jgi:hypothetical protein
MFMFTAPGRNTAAPAAAVANTTRKMNHCDSLGLGITTANTSITARKMTPKTNVASFSGELRRDAGLGFAPSAFTRFIVSSASFILSGVRR